MSPARVIESLGASVSLVDGKVKLTGLDRLDRETAARVLEVARSRKAEIVSELRGKAEASPVPPDAEPMEAKSVRRRWMTPALVANFKAARPWLLERMEALLAAGWTRDELFRVRRPLGHPYAWGVAWGNVWRTAGHVELQPNGWIAFHQRQHDGRVNVLHSWPRSTGGAAARKDKPTFQCEAAG